MRFDCMLPVAGPFAETLDRVVLAEQLSGETVWVTHGNSYDPFLLLQAYAARTHHIRVGTGITPIYTCSPAQMAQKAATLASLTGGRHVLGLGVSHAPIVEAWHGQRIDKPGTEQREYTQIVRAILCGERPPAETFKFRSEFALAPELVQPDLPIYVSALSPRMIEVAGEVADGVLLWLCNPTYIRDVVIPHLTRGRERAGLTLDGFEIVPIVPAGIVEDEGAARASMRGDLVPYFGFPFYRAMIERSGFGEDIERFDAAASRGDYEAMLAAIGDGFLDAQAAVGDATALADGLRRYIAAGATRICLGPIARADFEATLRVTAAL
ncbi:MAG TPA: LLM class flavin-dependent oxidoreductase [Solirubrobacteraceae bacterium]|nr:LLM class flavin-dependent oxidoreductase [Solirubrobacteraceae bacterium]